MSGRVTIPLKDGAEYELPDKLLREFELAYPNVDVPQTLQEIRCWCLANAARRKTRRGAARFVNNWLATEQRRAHGIQA